MKAVTSIFTLILAFLFTNPSFATSKEESICDKKIELPGWHDQKRLVIFGEVHGTNEMPGYFSDVICNYSMSPAKSNSVLVLIELRPEMKAGFDEYLNSSGSLADKQKLVSGKYWRLKMQDGRTSVWLVELLDKIRQLINMGKNIEVVPFVDYKAFEQIKGEKNIDDMYAKTVDHYFKNTDKSLTDALIGNFHVGWSNSGNSMVDKLQSPFANYLFIDDGGSNWSCTGEKGKPVCKVRKTKATHREGTINSSVLAIDASKNFQGYINVGKTTASVPAVDVFLNSSSH